jgi:hypothetical protein
MATISKVTVNNFTGNPQVETPFPIYSTQYNTAVDQINANTTAVATAQAAVDALEALNMTAGGTTNLTDTVKVLVSLTSANLLAMYATPITVLAAPGAGKAWRIKNCVAIFDSTVTTYANGGVIYLSYNNTTPITNNVAASFLTAGDKVFTLNALAAAGGNNMLVDTKVTITNDTAAFITGTGVARLLIEADVVTTGL